jgi:hypothetical protein
MPKEPERILTLVFENDGKTVHKETSGFVGKDCEAVTDFIEKALNASDIERTRKHEYFEEKDKRIPRLRA